MPSPRRVYVHPMGTRDTKQLTMNIRLSESERQEWQALAKWRRLTVVGLIRMLMAEDRARLTKEGHRVPKRLPEREPPR